MSWVMPLYGKSGCGVSHSAELARPQISPMACCIWPPMSRRLSLAVNSSSMVVQRPNSAGKGESAGLEGKVALITGAGGPKESVRSTASRSATLAGAGHVSQDGVGWRRRRGLRRWPRDGRFGKLRGGCGLCWGVGPDAGDEGTDESWGEPLRYGSVETKVARECSHLVGVAPRLYCKLIVHGAMLTAKETL